MLCIDKYPISGDPMSVTAVGVHEELGATVRQVLAQHASPEQTLRRLEEALGYDQAAWRRMAPDMELPGLAGARTAGWPGVRDPGH